MISQLPPVQIALLLSIFGSALAVGIPQFYENLHASRLNEPLDGLAQIAARASIGAAGVPPHWAYPASVPMTPGKIPHGTKVDPVNTWADPTWRKLDFRFEKPHHYSFEFESTNGQFNSSFIARAVGDLDRDGQPSSFELHGSTDELSGPKIYPIEMVREIE